MLFVIFSEVGFMARYGRSEYRSSNMNAICRTIMIKLKTDIETNLWKSRYIACCTVLLVEEY